MEEQWIQILDCPKYYEISSRGRVRTQKGIILKRVIKDLTITYRRKGIPAATYSHIIRRIRPLIGEACVKLRWGDQYRYASIKNLQTTYAPDTRLGGPIWAVM